MLAATGSRHWIRGETGEMCCARSVTIDCHRGDGTIPSQFLKELSVTLLCCAVCVSGAITLWDRMLLPFAVRRMPRGGQRVPPFLQHGGPMVT